MLDFFTFNTIITPYVIAYVYFIGAVIIPIILISYAKKTKFSIPNLKTKFTLLLIFMILELCWRIFCEFFIVYFKLLQ